MEENDKTQEVQPDLNEQEVELVLEDETDPTPAPEKDWKSEALKYKAIAQRYAKKKEGGIPEPKQALPKDDLDVKETLKQLTLAEKKRQFGYKHSLSPEEVDAVFRINPEPNEETLKDPFVEGGLAKLKSQKRIEDNTPSSSSRSVSFRLPNKENMTSEDKQANFEKFKKERFGR